ncbi:MAG: GC-type dockerin domain-anchored protein, partial [Planctomycetota bacterium]
VGTEAGELALVGDADTNGDGFVTPGDFNAWVLAFNTQNYRADQNNDGLVNPGDFNTWVLNFNLGVNGPLCVE